MNLRGEDLKLYNFKRLINKYSVTFSLHQTQGSYVAGKWEQSGKKVKSMRGAIVPISDKKIYGSGGTYTTQDRELYLQKPLNAPLSEFKVAYKGNVYTVEEGRNFEDFADAVVYILKWHSKVVADHD